MIRQPRKRKTPSKRRTKKAKVFVPAEKIILFCTVIFACCAVLLAVTSFMDNRTRKIPQNSEKTLTQEDADKLYPNKEIKSAEPEQYFADSAAKKEPNIENAAKPNKQTPKKNSNTAEKFSAKTAVKDKSSKPAKSANTHTSTENIRKPDNAKIKTEDELNITQNAETEHSAESASKRQEIASAKTASSGNAQNPAPAFDIPPAVNKAVLVFVFDDAGLNPANVKRYTALPFPVTIAVLPKLSHSRECAEITRASGNEVILHQPMQAVNLKVNPGPGAILPEMSTFEIASVLKENLSEIGPVKGLNNHEGSLITQDVIKIGTVLDVADEVGIFFLDSRTTAETKAPQAALERGMQIYERDVFIDDVITRRVMLSEICRGINIANKKGAAIMIGHVDKSVGILPALLADLYPHLVKNGYRFSTVSNSPVKTQ